MILQSLINPLNGPSKLNLNNASLFGGASLATDGAHGTYLHLTAGTSDYATMAAPIITTYPITMASWVRFGSGGLSFAVGMTDGTTNGVFLYKESNNKPTDLAQSAVAISLAQSSATVGTGTWIHLACVYASTTLNKLYVGGSLVDTNNTSDCNGLAGATSLRFGKYTNASPNYSNIDIASVYVISGALSGAEILALSAAP